METGLVHLYCGNGKGKTTAALGLAIRAAGAGRKVVFLQFMKGNETSELWSLALIPGITVLRNEKRFGFYHTLTPEEKSELRAMHQANLDRAAALAEEDACDVLILDEVTYAWNWELLDRGSLERLMQKRPGRPELVLTGRDPAPFLVERADYVTEMRCIRHPYEKNTAARLGIEF